MSYQEYSSDLSPKTGLQSPGGIMPEGTTSYRDADGDTNAAVTLPTAVGRRNEILTIAHNATADAVLQGTNKTPNTALTLSAANRVTRWVSDGATWRAVEDSRTGGNVTAVVTNVSPIAVLPVGDLFEVSMPASTDVRIRSLVNRQVYITSEGEYPGGSFTTSTAAIVNLTPTFVPADNNVHVNGELNVVRVQDILSGRLFVVTVWRLGAISGNWSGWVEEIGVSFSGAAPAPQDFFRKAAGVALPDGVSDYTSAVTHNGFLGLGLSVDPIAPLEFGDAIRNDTIRLWDNAQANGHQFRGFGVGATELRYQVEATTASHVFWGGASATASTRYTTLGSTFATVGDISAPLGTSHWTVRTDGKIQWRSPNSATAVNKIGAQIYCNGPAGVGGITGTAFDIQTTATNATENLISRFLINNTGDILISDTATPFAGNNIAYAKMTINGALRVRSGPIVPGDVRQANGIVFGAGVNNGTLEGGAETDGGITSIADNNLTFYTNGVVAGRVDGGVWSKPGGGTWAATSDIRTKKNVKPFVSRLSNLLQLEVITFNYNGKGGTIDSPKSYTGLSAQSAQKLFPEWILEVNGESIDKTPVLQVDNSVLIYELLEAVKSQQAEIATLKAEVATLKAEVATLKAEVAALKSGSLTLNPGALPSVTIGKVAALLNLDDAGLIAIGFSAASVPSFRATCAPLKTAIAAGLPEADILKLLAPLLAIAGLDVGTVLARL